MRSVRVKRLSVVSQVRKTINMCGIIASAGFTDTARRFEKIRYRGTMPPQLTMVDEFTIGHVLLAIQNTSGLSLYEDADCVFAYNGEVYDDWSGYSSDTEWLLNELKVRGVDSVCRSLNGMFAFIYYDKHKHELYVARDYLGIIPLYYFVENSVFSGRRFLFANEIKCFYGLPSKQVKMFPHGHYAKIVNGKISLVCYHRISHTVLDDLGEDYFLSQFRVRLAEAVRKRLKATSARVCALLSGGVDSVVIAALAKQFKPDIEAFTFSVGDKGKADLYYARLAAKALGVPLHEVVVEPDDVLCHLPEVVYLNEDSVWTQTSSAVGQYFMAKEIAKCGYRVAVGGEVSDEIFASYPQIQRWSWRDEQYVVARARLIDNVGSNNLSRGNKVMLGAGTVEVRNPMEDRNFLEFAGNVPPRYKDGEVLGKKRNKYLLRKAFADLIPQEIAVRPKGCQGTVSWVDEVLEPIKGDIKQLFSKMFDNNGVIANVRMVPREFSDVGWG